MKFYAVANGRKSGVFETWNECQGQVNGFSGAIFKSFKSKEDAEKFLREKTKKDIDSVKIEPINDGTDVKEIQFRIQVGLERKNITSDLNLKRKFGEDENTSKKIKKHLNVYTDGGCSNNGTKSAVAGIGVFFEGGEYEDVSEKIDGLQTNNRAELTAILRAITIVKTDENIIIHSDSEYSIKGITGINRIKKNMDLFEKIATVIKERKGGTIFQKVDGHSGMLDGNYKADKLASKALLKD